MSEIRGKDLVNYLDEIKIHDKDPSGIHTFTEDEKEFIKTWVQYKNINVVSSVLDMGQNEVAKKLNDYYIWGEIRRLSGAISKVMISQKIMTLDEMQSYLSALITDNGLTFSDQLITRDKITAMKLLLDIKKTKADVYNGDVNAVSDIPAKQLESLSVDTIKALLDNKEMSEKKTKIIQELSDNLSAEEINELKQKPLDELLEMKKKIDK